MRNVALLFSCFLSLFSCFSQETRWEATCVYMYAPEWDKAIQTYNFSRPFLENQQPLFEIGAGISAIHIFGSKNRLNHGFGFAGTFFESRARNENLDNKLNLGILKPAYLIHLTNPERISGFYGEFAVSMVLSILMRRVNGELFDFSEGRYRAYGIGGEMSAKIAYLIPLRKKYSIAPYFTSSIAPYLFSPKTEVLINQTQGLVGKTWTPIFSAQIGLSLGF